MKEGAERREEEAARRFYESIRTRRSVRAFSDRPVSRGTVEWLIRAAGSAPSGANSQPWRFVCVADRELKRRLRAEAEEGERGFYERKRGSAFVKDLEPLGTGPRKPFLEEAPWLVAVFELLKGDDGGAVYYPGKSVGIAVGFLLAAAHAAGLSTLVYTPSDMGFLNALLERPGWEKPYCIVVLGYAADSWRPPEAAFLRKPLNRIMIVRE